MDLRSLKYFIAVYDNGSFSNAAKQCYVAQPSISAAVAQLEAQLDTRLFARHARGVKPTTDGKKLYGLAKNLIGQANAITASFNKTSLKPEYKLGVTRGLGVKRMSALLKNFTTSAPEIALTLVPPSKDCNARIITKEELRLDEQYIPVWQEDYLLAIPHGHPLSIGDSVNLSDFHQLAMIKRAPCHAWQQLEELLALAGISLDIRAQIRTIDYALGLVSAGLGCAILPVYNEVLTHKDIVFRPISELHLRREIVLAYSEEEEVTSLLKQLVSQNNNSL